MSTCHLKDFFSSDLNLLNHDSQCPIGDGFIDWKTILTEIKKTNCKVSFFISKFEGKKNKLKLGEGQEMRWFTFPEILSLSNHGFKVGHNVIQILKIAKSKI